MKKIALLFLSLSLCLICKTHAQTEFYVDGQQWFCMEKDSISVCVSVEIETMHDLNYFKFNVIIGNEYQQKTFLFDEQYSAYIVNLKKQKTTELKVWNASEFNSRIKKLDMLTEGLEGFNNGMSGSRKTPAEKKVDNLIMAYNSSIRESNRKIVNMGYLKKNTLFPGDYVSGYVMSEKKKGDALEFNLRINNVNFEFKWRL